MAVLRVGSQLLFIPDARVDDVRSVVNEAVASGKHRWIRTLYSEPGVGDEPSSMYWMDLLVGPGIPVAITTDRDRERGTFSLDEQVTFPEA